MMKRFIGFLTAFMLMFAAISFIAPHSADAKGYKSGKRSYSPSQNETSVKSSDTKVNSTKVQSDTKTTATTKKSSGGFMKGILLGGLGGLLLGSLFAGLGPIGSILAFMVNMMLVIGIVMIVRRLFQHWKKRKQQEKDAWQR